MTAIQALVDGLADRLGMPVGVDDRRFRSIAYSSHSDEIDPVRRMSILGRQAPDEVTDWLLELGIVESSGYMRVPGNRDLHMVPRVCFPLRFHERLLGFMWLTESGGPLADQLLDQAAEATHQIAAELFRARAGRTGGGSRRGRSGPRADWSAKRPRITVRRAACAGHPPDGCRRRHRRKPPAGGSHSTQRRLGTPATGTAPATCPGTGRSRSGGDRAGRTEAELDRAAARVLSFIELEIADLPASRAVVGLGRPRTDPGDLPAARHEAALAARVARSAASHGPLARFADLEAYQLIAELVGTREPVVAHPSLAPYLAVRSNAQSLVLTAETYLERGGDAAAAARDLFIHRSSLYNRLHRVEELVGIDMRSGADRLSLHLGLRLWRLAHSSTDVDPSEGKMRRAPSPQRGDSI